MNSLKNPKSYSLFMSSELGRPRTNDMNQEIPPNFKEVNILFIGEDDGIFNNNDKIIFYGRGPSGFNAINNELIWNQLIMKFVEIICVLLQGSEVLWE